jgi:hypothetical protein
VVFHTSFVGCFSLRHDGLREGLLLLRCDCPLFPLFAVLVLALALVLAFLGDTEYGSNPAKLDAPMVA